MIGNIVDVGGNTNSQHFFPFPQCFLALLANNKIMLLHLKADKKVIEDQN